MKKMKHIIAVLFSALLALKPAMAQDTKITEENHDQAMEQMFPEAAMDIKTIGILVYDGFFSLDAIGPMAVLSELMGTQVFFIGLEKGLVSNSQMKIQVDKSIDEVEALDMLLVPGGAQETFKMTQNEEVLEWIRKIDKTTTITASVCTGAWILGEAGLLEGRKASTHWYRAEEMLKRYGAEHQNQRYTIDGKYWTSAGVTAGMDMSLALIQKIRGNTYLEAAMLDLEYAPQPPINAGIPEKSSKEAVDMMLAMYDMGLQPLIKEADAKKKK